MTQLSHLFKKAYAGVESERAESGRWVKVDGLLEQP